jgi:hypothetical protein
MPVPKRLYENINDVAVSIDGPPQILSLTLNRDEHFIQMPGVTELTLATFPATGVLSSEFHRPLSDRLVSDIHATLDEHFFDFPEAQTESIVEPDSVADDLRRETMPHVARSVAFHPGIAPCDDLT